MEGHFGVCKFGPLSAAKYFTLRSISYINMVAAAPILGGGDLKISDQKNWGEPEQKIKLRGNLAFQGGPMNPNDVMVVVLKGILLC